ncbi:MAG: hypothetical protein LBO62_06380, partial [Endomicrobium sp.]|nr:hypothetical protein [Endomicrobium sp.]
MQIRAIFRIIFAVSAFLIFTTSEIGAVDVADGAAFNAAILSNTQDITFTNSSIQGVENRTISYSKTFYVNGHAATTLNSGGNRTLTLNSGLSLTFYNNIIFADTIKLTFNNSVLNVYGTLEIRGGITNNSNSSLLINPSANLTIGNGINNNAGLEIENNGTLTINGGMVNNNSSLTVAGNLITINGGMSITNTFTIAGTGDIILNGGMNNGSGSRIIYKNSSGNLNINGNGTSNFSGTFYQSAGRTILSTATVFAGGKTINGGTFRIESNINRALSPGYGTFNVYQPGILEINTFASSTVTIDNNNLSVIQGTGTVRKSGAGFLNITANLSNFTGTFEQTAGLTLLNASGVKLGSTTTITGGTYRITNAA